MVVGPHERREAAASADVDDGGGGKAGAVPQAQGRIPKIPVWIRKKSEISLHFLGLIGRGAHVIRICTMRAWYASALCVCVLYQYTRGGLSKPPRVLRHGGI